MRNDFTITRKFGIFICINNTREVAGCVKLFRQSGPVVHTYNQLNKEWAMIRVWNLFFVAIHHIGEGLDTHGKGWYFRWPELTFTKSYNGFDVKFRMPDRYHPYNKEAKMRKTPSKAALLIKSMRGKHG